MNKNVKCEGKSATTNTPLPKFNISPLKPEYLQLKELPIDQSIDDKPRTVIGKVFTFSDPTPLKDPVNIVALSLNALNLLDADTSDSNYAKISKNPQEILDDQFLRLISGWPNKQFYQPLCHCYGGHQFGYWANQLGDGRAHIVGEYTNKESAR